jgi:DNA transformation protein
MPKPKQSLRNLPNIGATLERKLNSIGIKTVNDLRSQKPEVIYSKLCIAENRRLPVCYYLYTLEGAVKNIDWRKLTVKQKQRLLDAVENL